MLPQHRFFRIYGVNPNAWAKRHDIEPHRGPCERCGTERTTSIPFVYKRAYGLLTPPCACGEVEGPYCIVTKGGLGDLFGK